jgi:hypothetical protein
VRKLLLGGCLIGVALALSACGGGESDEDKIASAIETSATSTDPADCSALLTQNFLEQVEFGEGQAAVKSCEEDAKDESDDPDSVTVTEVEVDGSNAAANAAFVGGTLDGQTVAIGLVKEDGDWKLDELESFAEFDREALIAGLEESFNGPDGLEEEAASCIIEELEASSEEELEKYVLEPETFLGVAEDCA